MAARGTGALEEMEGEGEAPPFAVPAEASVSKTITFEVRKLLADLVRDTLQVELGQFSARARAELREEVRSCLAGHAVPRAASIRQQREVLEKPAPTSLLPEGFERSLTRPDSAEGAMAEDNARRALGLKAHEALRAGGWATSPPVASPASKPATLPAGPGESGCFLQSPPGSPVPCFVAWTAPSTAAGLRTGSRDKCEDSSMKKQGFLCTPQPSGNPMSSTESSGFRFSKMPQMVSSRFRKKSIWEPGPSRVLEVNGGTVRSTPIKRDFTQVEQPGVRRTARLLVQSAFFEYLVCALLLLNAVTTGITVEWMVHNVKADEPLAFQVVEHAFTLLFALEIVLRLFVYRLEFFWGAGCAWNLFDLAVVSLQLVAQVLYLVNKGWDHEDDVSSSIQPVERVLRTLRFLRLFRTIRLLRLVRFIADLNKVMYLIVGSIVSFFWTFLLLVLVTYIMGILFTQTVVLDLQLGKALDKDLRTAFGRSIGHSILLLYESCMGGLDSKEVMDMLVRERPGLAAVFMLYISFGILVMLNLVTGVFIETAQKLCKDERDAELLRKIRGIFDEEDEGGLSWDDFQFKLESPEMKEVLQAIKVKKEDLPKLFAIIDGGSKGVISVEDFIREGLRLQSPLRAMDLEIWKQETREHSTVFSQNLCDLVQRSERSRCDRPYPIALPPLSRGCNSVPSPAMIFSDIETV